MHLPGPRLRRPSRRSAIAIGAVLIAAGAGVAWLAISAASTVQPPATATTPSFTVAGSWSLLELQQHLGAGEVTAITAAGDGTGEVLVARTRDGQLVRIELAVAAADAARSLAGLGYGDLLTTEAWDAARDARPLAVPTDPLRSLLGIALPLAMLGAITLTVLIAFRGGLPRRRKTASFAVVMPAQPSGGASGAPAPTGVRLADVAGCDEAKTELTEVIDFLREPDRFVRLGATIPRGVLLFGPPGTGKTMLAKAVAAEAGVAFLHVSGSEFVEKYVGVGARRVRDLFVQARQLGRAVIFFDEFDALAKARGGTNGHEEREQTLNQLLVELDGFRPNDDVVVIAATNRLDVLDPAVLRPGRFNRKIHVGLPDVRGRREILAVHARNKPLSPEVDLDVLARKTYGFSGAQLADLLNEAAILTARRAGEQLGSLDVQAGWLKVAIGTGRRRSMDGRERAIIAAHEVGHAICGRVHGDRRRVEEISLFAHGEALGVTVSSQEDNDLPSETDLRARLVALMGGRAAEELLFQDVTGGASNDFEKATQIATSMVTRFGMGRDPDASDTGPSGRGVLSLLVPRAGNNLPSEVQPAATRAIRSILDQAYVQACETLAEHLPTLRRISAYLVEEERLDGETFEALFEGRMDVPTADDEWRPANARPREWGEVLPFRDRRFRRETPSTERRVAGPELPRSITPSAGEPMTLPGVVAAAVGTDALSSDAVLTEPGIDGTTAPDGVIGARSDAADGDEADQETSGEPVSGPEQVAPNASSKAHRTKRRRSSPSGSNAIQRRLRRVAAGWLRSASARIAPTEPGSRA